MVQTLPTYLLQPSLLQGLDRSVCFKPQLGDAAVVGCVLQMRFLVSHLSCGCRLVLGVNLGRGNTSLLLKKVQARKLSCVFSSLQYCFNLSCG